MGTNCVHLQIARHRQPLAFDVIQLHIDLYETV
jgi:hypothetical protein